MSNYQGSTVILTGVFQRLTTDRYAMNNIDIRNKAGNSIVYFGKSATAVTGFLSAGESKTFQNVNPKDIFVLGTLGEIIYWDGDGSLLPEKP